MAVPVAALAKIAAAALSDEDTRKRLGWIVAAICSPLILTLALICSLLSGSAEHNNSAVLLCFNGGNIPGKTPAEYVAYIEDMRRNFTLLDNAIAALNDMVEGESSLDGIRVKAVFYAIFFGEDTPSKRAHKQFVDCFVTYEESTRTVTAEDGTTSEERYTVAIPITDMAKVYGNIENTLHLQISEEQKSNADSVYNLVRYGVAGGSEGWIPGADVPFIGADGFCSPIGSGWELHVTSEFGNRIDPITGKRKGHTGMDLAVPTGTPIRAVLPALGNEFIVLLKDTSLITVIGGKELLYAAQGIMNRTYEAMFPLFGVALIYLVLVMIFTWLLAKFERRLAQSDR